MGKYTKYLVGLPRAVKDADDLGFRERVQALKDEVAAPERGAGTLANYYGTLRKEADALSAKKKELHAKITAVEELMWDAFDDAGLSSVTTELGDKVRTQPEPHTAVTDKDAVREWYKANGLERLLNPSWGNLNSIMKERLLAADDQVDGIEVKVYTKTVFTKGK